MRYLITTALEKSWKFDRPILFLGEWCCLYDRKHIWSNLDYEVAKPYGLKVWQREINNAYLYSLSSILLKELAAFLNKYHNTCYSVRYWHILIGDFLHRFVRVMYNRYFTIKQAMDNYDISGTTVIDCSEFSLATEDTVSFFYAVSDSLWNHTLYSKILKFFECDNIDVCVNETKMKYFKIEEIPMSENRSLYFKKAIYDIINKMSLLLANKNDAIIAHSYLPKKEEIKLHLLLGQIPTCVDPTSLEVVKINLLSRENIQIDTDNYYGFEKFIRVLLPDIIPVCYLEGYKKMVKKAACLRWPQAPKFILTGTMYFKSEIFRAWAASKVNNGVPYYISQHGSDQSCIGYPAWPELAYTDKYFTWGFSNNNIRHIPAFIFKTLGRKPRIDKQGGLLLIEHPQPNMLDVEDSYYKFCIYQNNQFDFFASLPNFIQERVIIRLHGCHKYLTWCDAQRWNDKFPNAQLELGVESLNKLKSKSRLIVHSYDSSGIPECLACNIPMLCFWEGGIDNILPNAKPYYELLKKAGILADNAQNAAELVTLYWDNVSSWWESDIVQEARKLFCEQYGRTLNNPLREFKKLLLDN